MLKRSSSEGIHFWQRIMGVYGIRAVVGHTGMPFLEEDRLLVDIVNVPTECVPYVVRNTQMVNLTSITQRG
ncbi:MAG: hypothetical protein ACKPKO_37310, partial [Candidatus Fonsibacter sp.]